MVDTNSLAASTEIVSPLRPPSLTIRSTSRLPDFSRSLGEYYYPLRAFGYTASVFADMYVDNKKGKEGDSFDKEKTRNRFAKWEAGAFAGLTLAYAARDGMDMMKHFRGALAAEYKKSTGSIGYSDMLRSNNPIIQKAVSRFSLMQVTRLAADASFLKNLNWGLLGMATRITIERTVFSQKTAYEKLEILFENTQIKGFDIQTTSRVAREFGNIIQQCQSDHKREPWDRDLIAHYAPLFDKMAEATISREIQIPEAVYMLGELMTQRLTLEQSLALFEQVRQNGLEDTHLHQVSHLNEQAAPSQLQKMSTTEFANKYLGQAASQKSLLERGQRSFGDMLKASELATHSL